MSRFGILRLALLVQATLISAAANSSPGSDASDWYEVKYVDPGVYVIAEPKSSQHNVSYLILGEERAVMIDTASGEYEPDHGTNIRHVIEEITELPVTLVLSHFHFDHNANIGEFDTVAFADLEYLRTRVDRNGIYRFSREELALGIHPEKTKVSEWWPLGTDIDLGGRHIKLLSIPGHTPDSIMILDEANKMAFTGDSYDASAALLIGRSGLDDYLRSVEMLLARLDSSYQFFGAHRDQDSDYSGLFELQAVLSCFKNDNCPLAPEPIEMAGLPALLYTVENSALIYVELPQGFYDKP
jgi:hydroxyacylglutathione hydrolase